MSTVKASLYNLTHTHKRKDNTSNNNLQKQEHVLIFLKCSLPMKSKDDDNQSIALTKLYIIILVDRPGQKDNT